MTSNDSERAAVSEGLNTVLRYLTSIPRGIWSPA